MELTVVEDQGFRLVEGSPDEPFMRTVRDATRVIEACWSGATLCALLHPANMTARFFDLSSGEAGEILQKLRNHGVRLAVVCPPGAAALSSRFGEMVAEERRGRFFGLFESREDAVRWLRPAPTTPSL
jgi:hypothetical protein